MAVVKAVLLYKVTTSLSFHVALLTPKFHVESRGRGGPHLPTSVLAGKDREIWNLGDFGEVVSLELSDKILTTLHIPNASLLLH
jgi:hypothetical protein